MYLYGKFLIISKINGSDSEQVDLLINIFTTVQVWVFLGPIVGYILLYGADILLFGVKRD
jgi:hypothetical protein